MKISLFAVSMLLAVPAVSFGEMEYATPESQGVSSESLLKWIDAVEETFNGSKTAKGRDSIHGFVLVRHGKIIAEGTWSPYDTLKAPHKLYSHSKSFTSMAIGMLADEGKLDFDERVVDIFSDKIPAQPTDNLKQLRIRDLLTMNVGADYIDAERKDIAGDWEKAFFGNEIKDLPGTHFRYDSCATHMLSAIVQKKTGMRMTEYLDGKLFKPLGFGEVRCTQSPTGVDCGGWGMSMTTRDMAKFGQLLLQGGTWQGKHIVSPEWVQLATARHTWSSSIKVQAQTIGSGSDWSQGYGFQFWRCQHGAFRADGAFGQITLVMPKEDAVLSLNAGIGPMQAEMDLVWKRLWPCLQNRKPLPENETANASLKKRCKELTIRPLVSANGVANDFDGRKFMIAANKRGMVSIEIKRAGDGWDVLFHTRAGENRFRAGDGKWERGVLKMDTENYEGLGTIFGEQQIVASAQNEKDGTFRCKVCFVEDTGWIDMIFFKKDGQLRLGAEIWCMGGCKFQGAAN